MKMIQMIYSPTWHLLWYWFLQSVSGFKTTPWCSFFVFQPQFSHPCGGDNQLLQIKFSPFIYKWLRCTGLSDLLSICIWHSSVRAYLSDLLTRLQSLLPNYLCIGLTLGYHIISRWIRMALLGQPKESFCRSPCRSPPFLYVPPLVEWLREDWEVRR